MSATFSRTCGSVGSAALSAARSATSSVSTSASRPGAGLGILGWALPATAQAEPLPQPKAPKPCPAVCPPAPAGSTAKLALRKPRLPHFIDWMTVKRLTVGTASVDLMIRRHDSSVAVSLLAQNGAAEVEVML